MAQFLFGMDAIRPRLLSPYFITNSEKVEAVMENTLVLIFDRKLTALKDLLPLPDEIVRPVARCWWSRRMSKVKRLPRSSSTISVGV
jgi:hypothetical protein